MYHCCTEKTILCYETPSHIGFLSTKLLHVKLLLQISIEQFIIKGQIDKLKLRFRAYFPTKQSFFTQGQREKMQSLYIEIPLFLYLSCLGPQNLYTTSTTQIWSNVVSILQPQTSRVQLCSIYFALHFCPFMREINTRKISDLADHTSESL